MVILEISQNSQKNTCVRDFFNKLQACFQFANFEICSVTFALVIEF